MSDALKYLRRLVADRKEEIPLGHVDLTELGWCTAVVLTLQQAGFDATLMIGKALGYRTPGASVSVEYQDEFEFHFIAVDGNSLPWPGKTIDLLGNEGPENIARAAAHSNFWDYVEGCRVRFAATQAEAPTRFDPDMREYYQRIYRQLAEHVAAFIAQDLDQASHVPPTSAARGFRL